MVAGVVLPTLYKCMETYTGTHSAILSLTSILIVSKAASRYYYSSFSSSFCSIMTVRLQLCLSISLLLMVATSTESGMLPPNVTVPALFGFGDSIIDPGNNNHLNTLIKCNFPPYGKDFMGGIPTGRFSNGKIPTDLLGIIHLPSCSPIYSHRLDIWFHYHDPSSLYIYVCSYVYVCMYACMHVCVYIYIHTDTHINISKINETS